jgi:hypothetical protein
VKHKEKNGTKHSKNKYKNHYDDGTIKLGWDVLKNLRRR